MKIEHTTTAYFADRAEAVDFTTKALGNPANNRVWFSFHSFEAEDRKYKVTVESTVET